MDMFRLDGRLALVTGSSQGLGLAVAEGLGRAGARVVLNGRNKDKLEAARAGLAAGGVAALARGFDVTDEKAVEDAVAAIEREDGPLDILVNNAGINRRAPIEHFPTDQWREVLETNLSSMFYVSRAVGRRMIERRRGKVINIASLLSEAARPTITPYAASKGAVKMFTKGLAVEWARHNIQVNAIGPGYFVTEMNKPLVENAAFDAWVKQKTPSGRWGQPRELAGAAVFFASAASDFVTGQILYVDGGWLANL